jgi:hypothetical protein
MGQVVESLHSNLEALSSIPRTAEKEKEKKRILCLNKNESQWLMSAILATWEAEIRRIQFQVSPGKIVLKTTPPK